MKELTIQVPDGKKAEWINGVLTLVDEEVRDNRPVKERIKTFADAMESLGQGNPLVEEYIAVHDKLHTDTCDLIAYLKLRIIAAALNEGWEPQFTEDEYRWYPWFSFWTEEELADKSEEWKKECSLWLFGGASGNGAYCGLAYAYSSYVWSGSYSDLSARLAVKSEELAVYFGKQFIGIWVDYVGPF